MIVNDGSNQKELIRYLDLSLQPRSKQTHSQVDSSNRSGVNVATNLSKKIAQEPCYFF